MERLVYTSGRTDLSTCCPLGGIRVLSISRHLVTPSDLLELLSRGDLSTAAQVLINDNRYLWLVDPGVTHLDCGRQNASDLWRIEEGMSLHFLLSFRPRTISRPGASVIKASTSKLMVWCSPFLSLLPPRFMDRLLDLNCFIKLRLRAP